MALIDLITNARAREDLPSAAGSNTTDDTAINTLITAASRSIMRYCRRSFIQDTYDELYNGRGERQLLLRNYPIQSVQSVRYRPVTVLKITRNENASSSTVQARVEVLSSGLRLTRVTAGVKTVTTTGLTFSGNATLALLGTAVNSIDDGKWQSASQGYDNWPSADLFCTNGSTDDYTANNAGQGALQCVAGSYAELKMHTYELQGYQINARHGGLLRAIPYTDPELLHPEDLIWPIGVNNFRIQYTAGYSTIPEDVQAACSQLVAYMFRLGPRITHGRDSTHRSPVPWRLSLPYHHDAWRLIMAVGFANIGDGEPVELPPPGKLGGPPPLPPCSKPPKKPGKPQRSASGLGAPTHAVSQGKPSKGKHFGHHKTTSPAKMAGMDKLIKGPKPPPAIPGANSMPAQGVSGLGMNTPYLPPPESWIPTTMDIYNTNTLTMPPPANMFSQGGISIMIAATPLEGLRSRTEVGFGYTHVLIMDINQEILDAYIGNSQGITSNTNISELVIPSAGSGVNTNMQNVWIPVISVITNIPGIGKKRIVLADRRYVGNPANVY